MDQELENISAAETSLKELLDKILTYFEKFIKSKEDTKLLEDKLNNYDSLQSLVGIISTVFDELTKKIDERLGRFPSDSNAKLKLSISLSSDDNGDHYEQLEKTMQKYEGEIRTHIRIEQQLKLYAESVQSKLDDSEKSRDELLNSTKSMINGVKRDNQKLAESLKLARDENERLSLKTKDFDAVTKQYQEKLIDYPVLQDRIKTLEKIMKDYASNTISTATPSISRMSGELESMQPLKKYIEVDYNKPHLRTEPSNQGLPTYQRHASPLRVGKDTSSSLNPSSKSSSNSEYLKVKIEIMDGKQTPDSNNFPRYNPAVVKNPREQRNNSVSKTREMRTIYKVQPGHNLSNNSLIYNNSNNNNNNSNSNSNTQITMASLQQRSKSTSAAQKARASISKQRTDLSGLYSVNQDNQNWQNSLTNDRKNRYL